MKVGNKSVQCDCWRVWPDGIRMLSVHCLDKIRYLCAGRLGGCATARRRGVAETRGRGTAIDRTPPLKYSKHAQIKLVFSSYYFCIKTL